MKWFFGPFSTCIVNLGVFVIVGVFFKCFFLCWMKNHIKMFKINKKARESVWTNSYWVPAAPKSWSKFITDKNCLNILYIIQIFRKWCTPILVIGVQSCFFICLYFCSFENKPKNMVTCPRTCFKCTQEHA